MPFHDDDPLVALFTGDGRHWLLTRELHWDDPEEAWTVIVPVGFSTDLASIPRAFWPVFPPHGRYAPAAVVHDWLYWAQHVNGELISRRYADHVLRTASGELGVSWATRWAMWSAVRVGGGGRWNRYRDAQAAGKRKAEA
jgi:hypothetical protein